MTMQSRNDIPVPDETRKRGSLKFILKVGLVVAIFGVVFYLIYFTVQYGKATFILSNQEITSGDDSQVTRFEVNDKIFFFISRHSTDLDSNLFIIEIEYNDGENYRHYKKISYEVEKDFPKISAYIPSEYFRRSGKYRIKASLDGKIVAIHDIEVD